MKKIILFLFLFFSNFHSLFSADIEMLPIPSGTFTMGDVSNFWYANPEEKPLIKVTLTKSFLMSKYEVTQECWTQVMGINPSSHKGDSLPVENISWYDAVLFCNKLSNSKGVTKCYTINGTDVTCDFNANGYRLPTIAEWEYSCRAGTTTDLYTGKVTPNLNSCSPIDNSWDRAGWYCGNSSGTTHKVGLKLSNAFGLYDMHGNVWEWCWDYFDYYYNDYGPKTDPTGPTMGTNRDTKGGAFTETPVYGRSSDRNNCNPNDSWSNTGLRVVEYDCPKISLKLQSTNTQICVGDSSILKADNNYSSYQWYRLDPASCLSTHDSLIVKNSGCYYCTATDQHGCPVYSDTMKIELINTVYLSLITSLTNGEFTYDTTYYSAIKCLALDIKNISNETIILKNVHLKYNVAFSVPQDQFPKTILPLAQDSITVCYSPTIIGNEYDTLELTSCNSIYVPLNGLGKSNYYGISKCQVPVQITIDALPNIFHQNITQPVPNPGTEYIKISYENYIPNNENISIKAELYDIFGNIRCEAISRTKNIYLKDKGMITTGEYIFDTKELYNGNYIIRISNPYETITWNVTILK